MPKAILKFKMGGKRQRSFNLANKNEKLSEAIMEFDSEQGEFGEFMDAFRGWQWKLIVSELDEWMRRAIKDQDKNEYEPVREKLYELVNGEGLTIWE